MAPGEKQEHHNNANESSSSLSSSLAGSNKQAEFDNRKAEAFSAKMLDILNGGAVSLMISIGHQTRLFDVMSKLPPSTSEDIASAAKS